MPPPALNISDITGETDDNLSMSPGIRNRLLRLAGCDRLLLLLTVAGSSSRSRKLFSRARPHARPFWILLLMILEAAILGVVAYSVIRQQRRPAGYGFSFKSGDVVSLDLHGQVHPADGRNKK